MLEELEARAAQTVEMAVRAGAQDAWATAGRTREVGFTVRNSALEEVTDSTSRSISLRLFVDQRYSTHATTDLRPGRLGEFIAEAVALTRELQPDEFRCMPDPARFPSEAHPTRDLDLDDPGVAELDRDQRMDWCSAMDARVSGKPEVISVSSAMGDTQWMVAAASSNGFRGSYTATSVSLVSEITLDEGDRRPEETHWAVARHVTDLPDAERLADEALALARARLGTVKGKTQRTTLVVASRAAGQLVGRLLSPAQGALVQQEQSFWRDRLSRQVVSERLTVTDDPLRPRGLASRPFDSEGFGAEPLALIEAGRFRNLYLDTYYGEKLGMPPTTGSPSNRVVELGTQGLTELLSSAGDGVYVNAWLGGNMDSTTGDFSFGIRGHLIEGGQLGTAVAEMNVTGNLMDLFTRLSEVGNDPWQYSAVLAPTLVFEDVQFSGV